MLGGRMGRVKRKNAIAAKLARSLTEFYPECADQFLCPTCLRCVPLDRPQDISEAHIVPRAVGGRIATVLCTKCNSAFGTRQDKWMGEYWRVVAAKHPFAAQSQAGYFEIGGVRVGGRFQVGPDRGIEFLVRPDKSSPAALRSLEEQLARAQRDGLSVTVPVPALFSNKDLVSIGYLTAAYLLWFRELGYSWALQDHLEPIREQIRSLSLSILPKSVCGALRAGSWDEPWIGIGELAGETALVAGLFDRVVFLPPADRPDFYTELPQSLDGIQFRKIRAVHIYEHHSFEGPVGVVFGDRILVAPDVFFLRSCPVMFLPPDGSSPQMLYPITDEEFERQVQRPDAVRFKGGKGLVMPGRETGRPTKRPRE